MREQPVVFLGGPSHLVGILHRPQVEATPRRGVLFLSPGVHSKAGHSRFHRRLARQLAARGWAAFRFDFPGLGESEGDLLPTLHLDGFPAEMSRPIVSAALETFRREAQVEEFILYGLCDGARTALKAASADPRVRGLVLVGLPLVRGIEASRPRPVTLDVHAYLRKARRAAHWQRFLTFKSDYRFFAKAMGRLLLGRADELGRLDPEVIGAIRAFLGQGKRILFIYGARDPFYRTFAAALQPRLGLADSPTPCLELPKAARLPPRLTTTHGGGRQALRATDRGWDGGAALRVIPDSSHAFQQAAAQEHLLRETLAWLEASYPASGQVATCRSI